jgi:hypothetical protein
LKWEEISVELSDELEKKLRFKTIERFGGKRAPRLLLLSPTQETGK